MVYDKIWYSKQFLGTTIIIVTDSPILEDFGAMVDEVRNVRNALEMRVRNVCRRCFECVRCVSKARALVVRPREANESLTSGKAALLCVMSAM